MRLSKGVNKKIQELRLQRDLISGEAAIVYMFAELERREQKIIQLQKKIDEWENNNAPIGQW